MLNSPSELRKREVIFGHKSTTKLSFSTYPILLKKKQPPKKKMTFLKIAFLGCPKGEILGYWLYSSSKFQQLETNCVPKNVI